MNQQDLEHAGVELPNIRLLPDNVINQIAAGEVIERPVAVVKELVENSLDAKAKSVEIEFRHGGKSYIRVEDDGLGMSPDGAMLALERHATSKLRATDDLLKIHSLGFRGEALPSIASVSRFTLKTRAAAWSEGSEIFVNGGKLVHQKACGMPVGTRIEVVHLFNAVPARRKFLKTDNTEAAHIVHLVRLLALAWPNIHFKLIENGRLVFKSPSCPTIRDRILEIWGRQMEGDLIELGESESDGMTLSGLIGKPGVGRSARRNMICVVNGRAIDSRTLSYALIEGYHTFMPKGRFPIAFLFLKIEPHLIDVNIHPAKRELRFSEDARVRQFVLKAVQARLIEASRVVLPLPKDRQVSCTDEAAKQASEWIAKKEEAKVHHIDEGVSAQSASGTAEKVSKNVAKLIPIPKPSPWPASPSPVAADKMTQPVPSTLNQKTEQKELDSDWVYLAKLQGSYALFESPVGMVLLDVRAAHQRILFERLQKEFILEGHVLSQALLIPLSFELEPLAAAAFEEHRAFFVSCGFQIEEFGRHFYRIYGYPNWLEDGAIDRFLVDLVSRVQDGEINPRQLNIAHESVARMAALRSVQFVERISPPVIQQLLRDLLLCDRPSICPRGKKTFFEVSLSEIEAKLKGASGKL